MRMEYRRHDQPGCGGCFLLILLLVFLTGGAPLVFEFLGMLVFAVLLLFLTVIAGFWAFSFYIKRQISAYEKSQTEAHNRFVYLLVHILVRIARMDGTVTKEEIATIQRFFQQNLHYTQQQLYWVKELIKEAIDSTVTLENLLVEFRGQFAYEPRLILLELIYRVLYTNARVSESELAAVRNIARYLEISLHDQRIIEARYRAGAASAAASAAETEAGYFRALGLEPGADFSEIKAAYRRLSMQYHPDKVRHLGDEFKKVAEEKMKELNAAYEFLKKKYGN